MPKRRKWRLDEAEVEVNAILAKLRMKFKKEGLQEDVVRQLVQQELQRATSDERETPNVIAETVAQIARRERTKAIRSDRYYDALGASVLEYFANKSVNPPNRKRRKRLSL